MPASETGLNFTNILSLAQASKNRILYNGSGVAAGDVNGDGWCDLYFCRLEGPNQLYLNRGGWRFELSSAQATIACEGQFSSGACLADLDGDEDLDLLVSSIGKGVRSFLNDGTGKFQESSAGSGLAQEFGSHSMASADIDNDGDLDLYVVNYRTTTVKDGGLTRFGLKREGNRIIVPPEHRDRFRILKSGDDISAVEIGEPDLLYLNDGHGKFTLASWTEGRFLDEAGNPLKEAPHGWGLSAMFHDVNADGAPDLYVCNDFFSPDRLWLNDGKGTFRSAPGLTLRKTPLSSMAVDFADINRDGWDDFFVVDMLSRQAVDRQTERSNFENALVPWWGWPLDINAIDSRPPVQRNTLFLNQGDRRYTEIGQLAGLEASGWSWGCTFVDVDLDGYPDVLVPNGHGQNAIDSDVLKARGRRERELGEAAMQEPWPALRTPNVAFRNRGDLTFEEVGKTWGFDIPGISNGMVVSDLDNDGDLDVALNNLNEPATLLRNDATGSRIAIRLQGAGPNTQGIGSRIEVNGFGAPQSQEVIAGGRYLCGDDPLRVFAAGGRTNSLSIRVTWRSGAISHITNVVPDHAYLIQEPSGLTNAVAASPATATPPRRTWFEESTPPLRHQHVVQETGNDTRQPLLPRNLSHSGPGVTWADLNSDGQLDLVVGAAKGAAPGGFINNRRGGFNPVLAPAFQLQSPEDLSGIVCWAIAGGTNRLLLGISSHQDSVPDHGSILEFALTGQGPERLPDWEGGDINPGPLAMGDIDGDGDLDLFVGGLSIPGRYPQATPSRLYQQSGGRFSPDTANTRILSQAGLVNGAVFTDLDGDGLPELVLACEWGPVRVFQNRGGNFTEATASLGLDRWVGWWTGVSAGDFDRDGRMDLVAANWGRNHKYQAHLNQGLRMYSGDLDENGTWDLVEAYLEPQLGKEVPLRDFRTLSQAMPFLRESFETYRAFASAGTAEMFGDRLKSSTIQNVNWLDSTLFLNRGNQFAAQSLPIEAQFSPAFAVCVGDADGDGNEDVFLSQNFFGVDRETGRYDGGRGLWLKGDGQGGLVAVAPRESGINVYGEQRGASLGDYDGDGRLDLVVTQMGASTRVWRNRTAQPGLRITLQGPAENRNGYGAQLRLVQGTRSGPIHELHCGSGFLSSESPVVVLGWPTGPAQLWVRWPGGKTVLKDVPAGTLNIQVSFEATVKPPAPIPDPAPEQPHRLPGYSHEAKRRLIERLPKPMFREVAKDVGLNFRHASNPASIPKRAVLEIPMDIAGGGVSAGDYDGDGFDDLFFAGFGGGRLFHNEAGQRFTDATASAGLALTGESRAAYWVDYDNDGDLDVFITFVAQPCRLFQNLGGGRFADVSAEAGFNAHADITHEAVWFDADNDGWLDVYTASFGRWDQGREPIRGQQNTNAEPNRLYRHRVEGGRHRFEDIASQAGVNDTGWTHSVGAWDFDRDGKPDLFSFNDFGNARIYRNLGQLKFQECSEQIQFQPLNNGMGFSVMDLDRDGLFEAFVSEISIPVYQEGQAIRYRMDPGTITLPSDTLHFLSVTVNNRLYSETGRGTLTNRFASVFEPAEMGWSWDGSAIDYDNDGTPDFSILNGTEERTPRLKGERREMHLAQARFINRYANEPNLFFVHQEGFWYHVGDFSQTDYAGNSRGCGVFDFDGDGDLDMAINDFEAPCKLFRNEQNLGNSWIRLQLIGRRSNRNAIGARVEVQDSRGERHHALVVSRKGFLSQDPFTLHFGLGRAEGITSGVIHWPSGATQSLGILAGRKKHQIEEPR
jgi:hypothetical protein